MTCVSNTITLLSLSLSRNSSFSPISLFGSLHRYATFYDHRSRCQKKHPQRRHTVNEKNVPRYTTRSTSGTGLSSGLHQAPKNQIEKCISVHTIKCTYIVDVRFSRLSHIIVLYTLIYLYVSVYARRVYKRVSIYMCRCVLYTRSRRKTRGGTTRDTGTRRHWTDRVGCFFSTRARKKKKTKHDLPTMPRCVAPARGRTPPTVRVPQGGRWRDAARQSRAPPGRPAGRRDVLGPTVDSTCLNEQAAAPVPAERTVVGSASVLGGGGHPHESSADHQQRPENALDALLDELQTFSRPGSQMGHVSSSLSVHQGSNALLADIGRASSLRESTGVAATTGGGGRAPSISDIGRKGSVDSSSGTLAAPAVGLMGLPGMAPGGTLRRLHSYPSSSDTDTSPPIARLQALSLDQQAQQQQQQQQQQSQPGMPVLPQSFLPGQKPPVPERNAELLQLASTRRVPPPPPPRTSSRSPLASPTSPQLPPRNHPCNLQSGNATLRRPSTRGSGNNSIVGKEGKPPMALPPNAILSTVEQAAVSSLAPTAPGVAVPHNSSSSQSSAVLSTSNSSSCESVNSQEGMQSKRGRQEQLEQRHQELLRKQKALQEQYARLQQLQRNAAGLTTVPPAPPDLLKKTGSESNLLAKMGLGLSAASSGSLTSLSLKPQISQDATGDGGNQVAKVEIINGQVMPTTGAATTNGQVSGITSTTVVSGMMTTGSATTVTTTSTTTTSKVYETDIL